METKTETRGVTPGQDIDLTNTYRFNLPTVTPQFKILTTTKAVYKKNGDVNINPFFGASAKYVQDNIERAKEVYADVFRGFISAWFNRKSEIPCPPREWETLEI